MVVEGGGRAMLCRGPSAESAHIRLRLATLSCSARSSRTRHCRAPPLPFAHAAFTHNRGHFVNVWSGVRGCCACPREQEQA